MVDPSPALPAQLGSGALSLALEQLRDQARSYARSSKAANTLRAYRSDLADFEGWCDAHGAPALPAAPAVIALYITDLATQGRKASTIERRLAALSQAHQLAGHLPSPTSHPEVRTTMAGIRRTLGTAARGKAPLITEELGRTVRISGPTPLATARDRLLLLLGFAAALRRSELVALNVEDVTEMGDGLLLHLRRTKTDQEGAGEDRGVPFGQHPDTCPVRALRAWLVVSGITEGPLFRPVDRHGQLGPGRLTAGSVARIVQRGCRQAGLEAAKYGGHSLRAGLATAAAAGGASERAIMRQGGWKSERIARGYIRAGTVFQDNAASYVGL